MRGPWGKVSSIDLNISAGGWWTVRWSPGVEEKAGPRSTGRLWRALNRAETPIRSHFGKVLAGRKGLLTNVLGGSRGCQVEKFVLELG